ncbi:type IVB secretion system protein IcmJDotN [Alphaproteobacteria bacterium]|nr:type IVB secretion system protein IcmJDotN [Alphaproteobacteria bacterium]
MTLLPLSLGIARLESRPQRSRSAQKSGADTIPAPEGLSYMMGKHLPKGLKEEIIERDRKTCQYCGFKADKYQNVHHIDHNLTNIEKSNLATACVFCHQCFHIDQVGDMESGTLIWLPEIEQHELHNIARAVYVGRISQGDIAEASRKVYEIFLSRRAAAIDRISTDNPYIMATVMRDYLSLGAYKARDKKLDGIRLLPLDKRMVQEAELKFNQFPQILAYWRSKNGPFGGKAPAEWVSITQDILAKNAA